MEMIEIVKPVLGALIVQIPLFLVIIIGIALAFVNNKEHGRNASWLITLLSVIGIMELITTTINVLLPLLIHRWDYSVKITLVILGSIGFSISIIIAITWAMLIYLVLYRSQPRIMN